MARRLPGRRCLAGGRLQRGRKRRGDRLRVLHAVEVVAAHAECAVIKHGHTCNGLRHLVEQRLQHGAGFVAVLGEVVPLLNLVRPLATGQRRLVKGYVADQVERIEGLALFLFQCRSCEAFTNCFSQYHIILNQ